MSLGRILITGGTGSLGKALCEKFKDYEVIVYSRDEHKHEALPDGVVSFVGDVRDFDRLRMAMRGVDVVINAAAMKIVPIAEREPIECVKTNVLGVQNVIRAAIDCQVESVVQVSTDKAVSPINLYGATKLAAEKLVLAANAYRSKTGPNFSVVRYGNVIGSKGSVVPLWKLQAIRDEILTLTSPEMTRFMLPMEKAVELVSDAIGKTGLFIPKVPSMKILDIGQAVWEWAGNDGQAEYKEIGLRPGEKLHEQLDEDYFSNTNTEWWSKDDLLNYLRGESGTKKN